ncbi:MAG: tRNA (adenosine(37)-N6)-threonylcarbamoyltransferase complex dimerization subunit type 1 TsaB [Planctomycetaceae bacterium]|jgi:tRNA threonylcarbamoyladenosine biosynthesis protein TsaB|nr:tRNA (adenosine(37)-N6)-threonylcarbamoyltransferase complex dimerization subunit type 1 TsaB [Planctomycetaceae bacterium]
MRSLPLILALETTEKFGSVALLEGKHVLSEIALPRDRRSSQTLHPALQTLLESSQIAIKEIDIIAVVSGPGSFTGLRVGVTAAKVLAYTIGAKIIALDTFQTVASALPAHAGLISVGVDAQRGEVVAAVMRQTAGGHLETVRTPERITVAEWWNYAEQYGDVLFAGPALERWREKVPPHIVLADESDWSPKASVAGKLAAERTASETRDDVWTLLPIYSRQSAAEEKRCIS